MSTLTIITEKGKLNHHYTVENVAISNEFVLSIVMKEEETDDFLSNFLNGITGYSIQVDTDILTLTLKQKCSVNAWTEDEKYIAFAIRMEKNQS